MKAILIAIIALCFAVQAQAQGVQPKDTLNNYKKVNNTKWLQDSVVIGCSNAKPVWVTVTNDSPIDTMGVCLGNDNRESPVLIRRHK